MAMEFRAEFQQMVGVKMPGPRIHELDGFGDVLPNYTATNQVISIRSAVEIGWLGKVNKAYQVQWATQLQPNQWSNWGIPVYGNGLTNYFLDSTRDQPAKFYRVLTLE
jgi:hypothetical protein